ALLPACPRQRGITSHYSPLSLPPSSRNRCPAQPSVLSALQLPPRYCWLGKRRPTPPNGLSRDSPMMRYGSFLPPTCSRWDMKPPVLAGASRCCWSRHWAAAPLVSVTPSRSPISFLLR